MHTHASSTWAQKYPYATFFSPPTVDIYEENRRKKEKRKIDEEDRRLAFGR